MNQLKDIYYQKFRVSTILMGLLGVYIVYKLLKQETELTPQAFMDLAKMGSFQEIEFVEEEYFRNKEIRLKKVVGKIGNERFYC